MRKETKNIRTLQTKQASKPKEEEEEEDSESRRNSEPQQSKIPKSPSLCSIIFQVFEMLIFPKNTYSNICMKGKDQNPKFSSTNIPANHYPHLPHKINNMVITHRIDS